jgi:hypothetical protein
VGVLSGPLHRFIDDLKRAEKFDFGRLVMEPHPTRDDRWAPPPLTVLFDHSTPQAQPMGVGCWAVVIPTMLVGKAELGVVSHEYQVVGRGP